MFARIVLYLLEREAGPDYLHCRVSIRV